MPRTIILISLITISLHADIIDFYKKALNSLHYNKIYALNTKANKFSQDGVLHNKYANFTLNTEYSKTKVKKLINNIHTTSITLNDKLDLFDKNSYKIDVLKLDLESQKSLLNLQKEQLFVSLVNMIAIYRKTLEQLSLYKTMLNEQKDIYTKLEKLQKTGAMTTVDLLRFKNQLTSLQLSIINQENELVKMQNKLHLYAPNQSIPTLKSSKLLYYEKEFLSRNPQLSVNDADTRILLAQAKGLKHSYLPDITVETTYQQDNDPTSNGNNYSFTLGLNIPLNVGDFKKSQALQVEALSLKSKNIEYEIQRKNEYISRYQEYINATQKLKLLHENLDDYEKSNQTIKTAYLQKYVDFNTYMQVLLQTLQIKEQIIAIKYKKILEATILNNISLGVIYE